MAVRELGPREWFMERCRSRSFASQLARLWARTSRSRLKNWCWVGICAGCSRLFSERKDTRLIIDNNVNLSRWPFRRLAGDETPI